MQIGGRAESTLKIKFLTQAGLLQPVKHELYCHNQLGHYHKQSVQDPRALKNSPTENVIYYETRDRKLLAYPNKQIETNSYPSSNS